MWKTWRRNGTPYSLGGIPQVWSSLLICKRKKMFKRKEYSDSKWVEMSMSTASKSFG